MLKPSPSLGGIGPAISQIQGYGVHEKAGVQCPQCRRQLFTAIRHLNEVTPGNLDIPVLLFCPGADCGWALSESLWSSLAQNIKGCPLFQCSIRTCEHKTVYAVSIDRVNRTVTFACGALDILPKIEGSGDLNKTIIGGIKGPAVVSNGRNYLSGVLRYRHPQDSGMRVVGFSQLNGSIDGIISAIDSREARHKVYIPLLGDAMGSTPLYRESIASQQSVSQSVNESTDDMPNKSLNDLHRVVVKEKPAWLDRHSHYQSRAVLFDALHFLQSNGTEMIYTVSESGEQIAKTEGQMGWVTVRSLSAYIKELSQTAIHAVLERNLKARNVYRSGKFQTDLNSVYLWRLSPRGNGWRNKNIAKRKAAG